jgi:hypothetical protein
VSAPLKLVGFLALLALLFAVATVAGEAIGPEREAAEREAPAHEPVTGGGDDVIEGHNPDTAHTDPDGGRAAGHAAAVPLRGLAVSEGGLTMDLARDELPRGDATTLRFTVRDEAGDAVRDFDVAHARRMHLIVVRRDGRGFQHLHPRRVDGEWRVRMTIPQAGAYRAFADFERAGQAYTLAADVSVDGAANYRPLPKRSRVARVDGYRVERAPNELRFTITRGGRKITPQPYLGARGHLVALREGDLAFVHVHPTGDVYEADLERGTRYRLYLEFRHGGEVHTAEFTR